MKDINGVKIEQGNTVDVPAPNDSDMHNFEFRGTVDSFRDGYVVVSDGDGDCFSLEPSRLTVIDEEKETEENNAVIAKFLNKNN